MEMDVSHATTTMNLTSIVAVGAAYFLSLYTGKTAPELPTIISQTGQQYKPLDLRYDNPYKNKDHRWDEKRPHLAGVLSITAKFVVYMNLARYFDALLKMGGTDCILI